MVNWTLSNYSQWNQNQNITVFIQENILENDIRKLEVILLQPQHMK